MVSSKSRFRFTLKNSTPTYIMLFLGDCFLLCLLPCLWSANLPFVKWRKNSYSQLHWQVSMSLDTPDTLNKWGLDKITASGQQLILLLLCSAKLAETFFIPNIHRSYELWLAQFQRPLGNPAYSKQQFSQILYLPCHFCSLQASPHPAFLLLCLVRPSWFTLGHAGSWAQECLFC